MSANWGEVLLERFPPREAAKTEREWEAPKQRLSPGQSVTGVVIAKAHFGAWLDIGVGFPALLEIMSIAGLTPERYQADDWCPVGSEVTAQVGTFSDSSHQVYLWQVRRGSQKPA
jgi:ribosomal protein S1